MAALSWGRSHGQAIGADSSRTGGIEGAGVGVTGGLDLRDYQLLGRLGQGGMGEVYLSRDPGLGRDLALKVLRPERQGDREAVFRFEQEARITGALQHPGVVPVHNLGRLPDGRMYFTMKVVRGQTFALREREFVIAAKTIGSDSSSAASGRVISSRSVAGSGFSVTSSVTFPPALPAAFSATMPQACHAGRRLI